MKLEIEIDAPWTNGPQTYVGTLALFAQFRDQLLYFQKTNDTEHIRKDIEGYEAVIKSNSEANANKFLEIKTASRTGELSVVFENNMEVISYLKNKGLWEN